MSDASDNEFKLVTEDIPTPSKEESVSSGKVVHGKLIPQQQLLTHRLGLVLVLLGPVDRSVRPCESR